MNILKAHLYFCLLYSYSNYRITQLNLRLSLGRNQIGSLRQSPFMSIILPFAKRYNFNLLLGDEVLLIVSKACFCVVVDILLQTLHNFSKLVSLYSVFRGHQWSSVFFHQLSAIFSSHWQSSVDIRNHQQLPIFFSSSKLPAVSYQSLILKPLSLSHHSLSELSVLLVVFRLNSIFSLVHA